MAINGRDALTVASSLSKSVIRACDFSKKGSAFIMRKELGDFTIFASEHKEIRYSFVGEFSENVIIFFSYSARIALASELCSEV